MTANQSSEVSPSPFHAGEQQLQRLTAMRDEMEQFGRKVIRSYLTEQHRDFYRQLPFVILGAVDAEDQPWATILSGQPGFLSSPDAGRLRIAARPLWGDPAADGLRPGARIGGLGIEFATRRRNRFSAAIAASDDAMMADIEQAFGNCPQYIQSRELTWRRDPDDESFRPKRETRAGLDDEARALIGRADTFFVATTAGSRDAVHGVDVSHRGGKPGFVRVGEGDLLTIPDFAGNYHFNTLGNLLEEPRAGLLFMDFDSGDLLYLAGRGAVLMDSPETAAFRGAERLWTFQVERMVRLRAALPFRFAFGGFSPNAEITGDWTEAKQRQEAERIANTWRPFRVAKIVKESRTVSSFHLVPTDGLGLPTHKAGQFLPIRLHPAESEALTRTYTLTSLPGDRHLRISVKREARGAASRFLHDSLSEGDLVEAMAPRGDFTLDNTGKRPLVLISGGVGITPMLAMLRDVARENFRTRGRRAVWFLHSARTAEERPFLDDLQGLTDTDPNVHLILSDTARSPQARLQASDLKQILPFDDYEFFLCGPAAMAQNLYDGLRDLNVADRRIHFEAFGPSAVTRRPDAGDGPAPSLHLEEPQGSAKVTFAKSGLTADWDPDKGSLLDLAESHGLTPDHACRNGLCGTCAVAVRAGEVSYPERPTAAIEPGKALACRAVPRSSSDHLELDL